MAVAQRYNNVFTPKAEPAKSPFATIDARDFTEDGALLDPTMATQGGKYWGNVAANLGWDPKLGPPVSGGFNTLEEGGGSPGSGPAGDGTGISGFDTGLTSIGLGALGSVAPGIAGAVTSGIGSAVGAMGSSSNTGTAGFTASTENGPVGVTGINVPDNITEALSSAIGITGPMGFEATPTAATPDEDMSVSGNISSAAGYTDPANITAGAMGEGSQTAPNTADGSVSAGGGTGSAGTGAPGDAGTGTGAGEAPHTGGYIAGPGAPAPGTGGFGTVGVAPVVQALMQLKQMMAGPGPMGGRRRSDDPRDQGDGSGMAAGSGLPSAGQGSLGGDSLVGGGGEAFGSISSAPSGDAASDSGAGDAASGDSGAGAGDAGGVGNDGSSGDAGGAGGAFHNGGYVGEQDRMGGDVMARLQPGEFVVPRGPMAEMLRQQNPGLTKYGSLLTKSPISNVVNPRDVAFGLPLGALMQGGKALFDAGKIAKDRMQQTAPQAPYMPSVQDAPENGGFPDPGQPNVPMPQNNNTPPSERQEPEPPALRNEQGMQKLKKLMLEFS